MSKLYIKNIDGTYSPYNPVEVSNLDIVQETGSSLTSAMSQKAVTDELTKKQDTINDLADIRSDAAKGATALQSETDPVYMADKSNIALKTEIPDISNLATKEEVAVKQDTIPDLISIRDGASKGVTALQPIQNITYAELVALRGSSSLVAGMQYRITDYACTTTQENTQSAGHPFDIIVTADSENTLNEEARAIQHEGDTYFANCDLNAWKIWYCLDNDASRFAWADSANGKGVIYRMIDEWNNDVPYDFKNIMFKRYILDANNAIATYVAKEGELNAVKTRLGKMSHRIHTSLWYYGEYVTDVYPNAEAGRKYVPFGDILYDNNGPGVLCPINEANSNWFYTFSDTSFNDNTVTGQSNVHNNVIKGNKYALVTIDGEGRYSFEEQENICLNDIIFIGNYCYYNSFGNNCNSNSFGNDCNYNSFGNGCNSNSFGNNCYYNSFGNNCNSNSFGNDCNSNSFGNDCNDIKFASSSSATTKYSYYRQNHFGDGCKYLLFKGAETASSSSQVQNYNFAQGVQGTSSAYLTIDGVRSRAYETKVAKNSSGELKIYCEADLIQ